jgi:hypothetical protein
MQPSSDLPADYALIYNRMKEELQQMERDGSYSLLQIYESCIGIVGTALEQLKDLVLTHPFISPEEEVLFFKTIKPRFYAHLLYYIRIYRMEINRPPGSKEIVDYYYKKELQKLTLFFDRNREFYQYYRSGATYLDAVYFLRTRPGAMHPCKNEFTRQPDSFSACQDHKISLILANELLSDYIHSALEKFNPKTEIAPARKMELTWTGQKVGLAELIYAFHASGVLNNSQIDIKKMTDFFSSAFNIQLGNIYKIFEEIRMRKKNRTVFLDSLRQNLLRKMDEDDEHAL